MPLADNFAQNVRKRRKELNLTQQQLAELVGCERVFVTQVEAGICGKTLDQVERFARALKCPPLSMLMAAEDVEVVA